MMKTRFLLSLSLILVLATACSPESSSTVTAPPTAAQPAATLTAPALEATTNSAPSEEATALPVATSRGPELHATDPTTVSLASGGLQFVEFFRFTWSTCRAMAPMVHGLEAKYFGKIRFTYLDADDPQTSDFQKALGFYYQPEVYLLDAEGNVLQKWVGYTSEEEFEAVFAQYLQWVTWLTLNLRNGDRSKHTDLLVQFRRRNANGTEDLFLDKATGRGK